MAIRFDGWSFWSYIELAIWRKRKVEVCRRTGIGEASHIIGVWPPLQTSLPDTNYKNISSNLMTAQECDQTLPKAQQTYGLRAFIKIAAFKSCHKLVKIQLQNLDQTSVSKSWLNFWLKMLINLWPRNLHQTSALISWTIFSVKSKSRGPRGAFISNLSRL